MRLAKRKRRRTQYAIRDTKHGLCTAAVVFVVMYLSGSTVRAEVSPGARQSAALAFTSNKRGEYIFDTGTLRGKLRAGGKTLGLSSVVHIPSGARLDGSYGILSYYRVFTTNKRYGTAAWDWPSTSKLLPAGAVQVTWPEAKGRPFAMTAIYRWTDPVTLDVETIVKAGKDLGDFEVFLASYFHESFPSPYVYVTADPQQQGKPGFLLADKPFGHWQMFPRDGAVLRIIRDGRWQKEPHPVNWVLMPHIAAPVCLRRGAANDPAAVLMSPPQDCFAIATPYKGESHYSLYLSLFGRNIKAGRTARAHTRFIVAAHPSHRQILQLYEKHMQDLADSRVPLWR